MKAIFPCNGSLIMTKNDIEKLTEFYDSRQIENNDDSKIFIENNYFNYFNDNSEIILDNVTPLTVSKLKKVLGISGSQVTQEQQQDKSEIKTEATTETELEQEDEELIDDESIFSNPFFTTLKPVD